jgi:hypothetical protein
MMDWIWSGNTSRKSLIHPKPSTSARFLRLEMELTTIETKLQLRQMTIMMAVMTNMRKIWPA